MPHNEVVAYFTPLILKRASLSPLGAETARSVDISHAAWKRLYLEDRRFQPQARDMLTDLLFTHLMTYLVYSCLQFCLINLSWDENYR